MGPESRKSLMGEKSSPPTQQKTSGRQLSERQPTGRLEESVHDGGRVRRQFTENVTYREKEGSTPSRRI